MQTHLPNYLPVGSADYRQRVAMFNDNLSNEPGLCWIWKGRLDPNTEQPVFQGHRQPVRPAVRVSYELYVGRIPRHHDVVLTCGVENCVCPEHLALVAREQAA